MKKFFYYVCPAKDFLNRLGGGDLNDACLVRAVVYLRAKGLSFYVPAYGCHCVMLNVFETDKAIVLEALRVPLNIN